MFLFAVCRVLRGKSVLNRQTRSHESVCWLSSAGRPPGQPAAPTGSTQRMFNERAAAAYLREQGGGLLCEPARFERYVAHYAGIVGSGFKHSHMIHTGAARRLCQGKLPAFPPRPGAPSAEGSSRSQDLPVIAFYRKEDTFSLDQFIS